MRLGDLDALRSEYVSWFHTVNPEEPDERTLAICDCIQSLDAAPTVYAEPVIHAYWISNTDDFTPADRCSNCGYNKPQIAGEDAMQIPDAFCPACGAHMDGKRKDADPIIYCKDCARADYTYGRRRCPLRDYTVMADDDSCSDGQRKDGGEGDADGQA